MKNNYAITQDTYIEELADKIIENAGITSLVISDSLGENLAYRNISHQDAEILAALSNGILSISCNIGDQLIDDDFELTVITFKKNLYFFVQFLHGIEQYCISVNIPRNQDIAEFTKLIKQLFKDK